MQGRLLRQSFLTHTSTLPESANRFSNCFLMSQGTCHSLLGKQEAQRLNTVHSPLFIFVLFLLGRVESSINLENMKLALYA